MTCGDGTLLDTSTGLMWEITTGTIGTTLSRPALTDVNNLYTWVSTADVNFPYPPSGSLYSNFLDRLNSLSLGAAAACSGLAGYCDWRIPSINELRMIVSLTACAGGGSGSACIDPSFGPTQASVYWSSSAYPAKPQYAWIVYFSDGSANAVLKNGHSSARAVRGGR